MSEEEQDDKETGAARKSKMVIGLVVVGVIAALLVPTLLIARGRTDKPTAIEVVEANVQSLTTTVATQELVVATQAELIADLRRDVNQLPTEMVCDCEDWTATIAAIQSTLTNLEASVLRYAWVSRIEDGYVDVTLSGDGDYGVMVTLYGVEDATAEARFPATYSVGQSYAISGNITAVVVEPIAEWQTGDIIELKVTTGVQYATAVVTMGGVESTPGW